MLNYQRVASLPFHHAKPFRSEPDGFHQFCAFAALPCLAHMRSRPPVFKQEHMCHSQIAKTGSLTWMNQQEIVDTIGYTVTLWLFNIAMENGPFIDEFPIKTSIYQGFSMAMLNNQMVTLMDHGQNMVCGQKPGTFWWDNGDNQPKWRTSWDFTWRINPFSRFRGYKPLLTLWLFNSSPWKIAHRNRLFTYWKWWFSMATLNTQMVISIHGIVQSPGIAFLLRFLVSDPWDLQVAKLTRWPIVTWNTFGNLFHRMEIYVEYLYEY